MVEGWTVPGPRRIVITTLSLVPPTYGRGTPTVSGWPPYWVTRSPTGG